MSKVKKLSPYTSSLNPKSLEIDHNNINLPKHLQPLKKYAGKGSINSSYVPRD